MFFFIISQNIIKYIDELHLKLRRAIADESQKNHKFEIKDIYYITTR